MDARTRDSLPEPAKRLLSALEEQLERSRTESEAAEIHFEQTLQNADGDVHETQSFESRHAKLLQQHESILIEKETLNNDLKKKEEQILQMGKKLSDAENHVLEKTSTLDRQSLEIRELQNDKRSLLQLLDQRNDELAEAKANAKSYLDKILFITEETSQAKARLRDAENEATQKEHAITRLTQEKDNIEKHSAWLHQELQEKSMVLLEERKHAATERIQLKSKVNQLEATIHELELQKERLNESNVSKDSKIQDLLEKLKETKEQLSSTESHYEEELATARRLSELHKESAEEQAARGQELEGILKSLRDETGKLSAAHAQEVKELRLRRDAARQEASDLQKKMNEYVKDSSEPATNVTPSRLVISPAVTPSSIDVLPEAGLRATPFQSLTPSAAYSKYVEAADAWRHEKAERRRLQAYLDEIMAELEKKAPLIEAQREEYEQLLESHALITARLESAASEKRHLEALLTQSDAGLKKESRARNLAEAQALDANKQVRRLLLENERLRGVQLQDLPSLDEAESSLVDANSVISMELVEYGNLMEMQDQNRKLLAIARQLAFDRENEEKERTKRVEEAISDQTQVIRTELEALKAQRERQATLVEQIARQRDLYRSLLHERDQTKVETATPAELANAEKPEAVRRLSGHFEDMGDAHGTDLSQLQQEYNEYKKEASENLEIVKKELQELQSQLSTARSEALQHRANADFQLQRYELLAENMKGQRAELETVVAQLMSARHSASQAEQRVAVLTAELSSATETAKQEASRASLLQSGKESLERIHEKDTERIALLTEEKYKLIAEAESAKQLCNMEQEASSKAQKRMAEQLEQMQSEWAAAQRELASERSRARDAASATALRLQKLEEVKESLKKDVDQEKDRRLEAEKKSDVANARLNAVQQQLRSAEETLNQILRARQKTLQQGGSSKSPVGEALSKEAQLLSEVASLKEELGHAQDAAVAAKAHASQFKAMAAAADESLKSTTEALDDIQKSLSKQREEHEQAQAILREKLECSQQELAETRKKAAESIAEAQGAAEELQKELEKLKADAVDGKHTAASYLEQINALRGDVEEHHRLWRASQGSYERELLLHAEDVKRMSELEHAKEKLIADLKSLETEREQALEKLKEAELKKEEIITEMKQSMDLLEARCSSLEKQNNLLHEQLEKLVNSSYTDSKQLVPQGESDEPSLLQLQEVVRFLRREKETLAVQLSLAQQERARLLQRAEHASRDAQDAKSQLEALKSESEAEATKEGVEALRVSLEEQVNLLRESNMALRAESLEARNRVGIIQNECNQLQSELESLKLSSSKLSAELESKNAELEMKTKEAARWRQRAQQLLDKYGQVDQVEHQRIVDALAKAQKDAEELKVKMEKNEGELLQKHEQAMLSLKKENEKLRQVGSVHSRQIALVYNPQKLDLKAWKEEQEQLRSRLNDLETAAAKDKSGDEQKAAAFKAEKEAREKIRQEMEREQVRLRTELTKYSEQLKKMSERLAAAHAAKLELAECKSKLVAVQGERDSFEAKLKECELEVARAKTALIAAVRKSSKPEAAERKPKQPIPSMPTGQAASTPIPPKSDAPTTVGTDKVQDAEPTEVVLQEVETAPEPDTDAEEGEYAAPIEEEEPPADLQEENHTEEAKEVMQSDGAPKEHQESTLTGKLETDSSQVAIGLTRKASEAGLMEEQVLSKRPRGISTVEAVPSVQGAATETLVLSTEPAVPLEQTEVDMTEEGERAETDEGDESSSEEVHKEGELEQGPGEEGEIEEEEETPSLLQEKDTDEREGEQCVSAEEGELPSEAQEDKPRGVKEQDDGEGPSSTSKSPPTKKVSTGSGAPVEKSEQGKHKSFERITFKPRPSRTEPKVPTAGPASSQLQTARGAARSAMRGSGAVRGRGRRARKGSGPGGDKGNHGGGAEAPKGGDGV